MKKILSAVMAIMVILSLAVSASADTWTHEASGITIELPEGMTGEDLSEGELIALNVSSEDPNEPVYFIFIEYVEDMDGVWMEDLDEEMVEALASYYVPEGENASYVLEEGENATLMMVLNEENTEAAAVALLNGWLISVEASATEGNEFADGAYEDIDALLAGIKLP